VITVTPDAARAMYRRRIGVGETIYIRRYTGQGTARPKYDAPVRARVVGYDPKDFVGPIQQGDRRVIFLAEDLDAAQFTQPVTASDKAVVQGKELAIIAPDNSTRRLQGELIAYELQVRG
jgi:hypothetical protein